MLCLKILSEDIKDLGQLNKADPLYKEMINSKVNQMEISTSEAASILEAAEEVDPFNLLFDLIQGYKTTYGIEKYQSLIKAVLQYQIDSRGKKEIKF
jgi:hypothetical protein